MQKPDTICIRQLAGMGFVGLSAPIIRLLPRQIVMFAGNAAWIAPLVAVVPTVLLLGFLNRFLKNRLPGEGLGDLFLRSLGSFWGKFVLFLVTLWLLFYAGFTIRSGADRFISTVYPNSTAWSFTIVMFLLVLMAGLGRLQVLARTARVFCPLLLLVFALVFAFSIPELDIKNLFPVSYLDIDNILLATIPVMNTIGLITYTTFLLGYSDDTSTFCQLYLKWTLLVLLIISLVAITALSIFGAEMVTKINHLFLVMIRGVSFTSLLERIEAFIIAFWVVTDFILSSMLLFICTENLHLVFGIRRDKRSVGPPFSLRNGRWLIWLCAVVILAVAMLILPDSFSLNWVSEVFVPLVNLVCVFVLLPVICLIGKLRKKI